MKTLRAIHTIHMTLTPGKDGDKAKGVAPTRPEVAVIQPGTRFKAQSAEQEAELLGMGAASLAEDPKSDEVVDTSGSKPKKAAATKPAAATTTKPTEGGEGEGDGSELV